MRKLLFVLFACFQLTAAMPQSPQNWTSADMYLAIRKLNVLGSVLYVAAHPDDENTRLIAYLSKDRLYRAGYLSMTRGDGGQNLIGDEQGIDLGLIRTQELLSARRIDGGEQFFTRAFDFGYSKTPEETFSKWHKEKILGDVVWVIRQFRPDVIITRFPVTGEGGHGHHTASAILANEAFHAAADPARFPEQLQYVKTWQAKRILWNTFNFGGTNLTRDNQFKIDVGGYNPLLGKSYGEIAAESRSQHKSQGFGVPATRGEALEYFKTTGGSEPVDDLMDGAEISWKRVSGGSAIEQIVDSLAASFDLLHPGESVKGLVRLYRALNTMPPGYWRNQKLAEVKQLIAQCSGLFAEATTSGQFAIQSDSLRVNFSFNNRLGTDAVLERVAVEDFDSLFSKKLDKNKNFNFSKTFFVPFSKPLTQPYWLENKMEEGYYNVSNPALIGQADVEVAYTAVIDITIYGQPLRFTRPVKYKFTDPVRGEVYQPVSVIPSYTVKVNPDIAICNGGFHRIESELQVTSHKSDQYVGFEARKQTIFSAKMQKGETRSLTQGGDCHAVNIYRPDHSIDWDSQLRVVSAPVTDSAQRSQVFGLNKINHDHIPAIVYFKKTEISQRFFLYETYGKKIGYITGAGDKVPEALEQMGYEVTSLGDKELSRNNLSQFDAIITGVRAYNTNDWMEKHYDRLMSYVNEGGNLVVQYNTSNFISRIPPKIGPFKFTISRSRITDENAVVNFVKPDHDVLNFPNTIVQEDFKGWVQERSIYHASDWDRNKFETILSMHDPGEKDDEGSLVIAKYGKGYFTYTGLVFFRELPAGVPGAYRLLANIIALNKKKGF